jgi:hypothetical protein
MAFSIELLDESASESYRVGLITIGSFVERFVSPVDYWDATRYRLHWRQAISRIVQGFATSALITAMTDPAVANFIVWWPMYRLGQTVQFQNQILFLNELETPFDPNDPFRFIRERLIINSDGEAISEWSVTIAELEGFLAT